MTKHGTHFLRRRIRKLSLRILHLNTCFGHKVCAHMLQGPSVDGNDWLSQELPDDSPDVNTLLPLGSFGRLRTSRQSRSGRKQRAGRLLMRVPSLRYLGQGCCAGGHISETRLLNAGPRTKIFPVRPSSPCKLSELLRLMSFLFCRRGFYASYCMRLALYGSLTG